MTTTVSIFTCAPKGDTEPVFRGKYEFQHLPRKDDRIVVSGAGPWQDILLVLNVTHHAIGTDVPALGRFEPWTEFVSEIGEVDDD